MLQTYRKIFQLFDAREKVRFWLITAIMVGVALSEVVGISTVLALLSVLSDPSTVAKHRVLSVLYNELGFESVIAFQAVFASVVMVVVLALFAVRACGTYVILRFAAMRSYSIASRLLGAYLHQPYAWFLERNSSDIGKNILGEVDRVVSQVITPAIRLLGSISVVIAIVVFLIVVDPIVTLASSVILGGAYTAIYIRLRERLRQTGEEMVSALSERFRITQEATGGVKDLKLLGLEDRYIGLFERAAQRAARAFARLGVMTELPRFAIEAVSFGTLLGLVLLLLFRSGGNIASIVPTLGIFAFAVLRLMPALQQIYQGLASMRSGQAILDSIATDFANANLGPRTSGEIRPPLELQQKLELSSVNFSYASANRQTFSGLNLTIPARTSVGIVGGTGAGKTTLVDLILGLLSPDQGTICVDGTVITNQNLRAWQQSLGYVPQAIFLTDDTIAANIAFGVAKAQIDMGAVERAARAAALHDFVMADLEEGYDTFVGERGVRLSGGQRQRIGIARALYRNPSLLIMDEATSALDNITERVVMEALQNIRADKTIILIAHRLTTVKNCDQIVLMDQGRIAAQGTYDELVAGNEAFRKMAIGH